MLALVYVLEGSDCHFENIIACGEYPVLVDIEALMHHRTSESMLKQAYDKDTQHSVLRTGFCRATLCKRWYKL